MVGVRRVPDDALVLLVEGVHRAPGERNAAGQRIGVGRQFAVLPGRVVDVALGAPNAEPGDRAQFGVLGDPVLCGQDPWADIAEREVSDRVPARLVQQRHILAVGYPQVPQPHSHASPQRFGEQQPLRQRFRGEKVSRPIDASGPCCQASPIVLPRQ